MKTVNAKSTAALSPRERAQAQYERGFDQVVKKISRLEKRYFIAACAQKIADIKNTGEISFDFEHVLILAIKISATSEGGKRRPTKKEMVDLINRIWRLHNCLIPYLDPDHNPLVAIRALANQQSTLQHNIMNSHADIMRQSLLLAESEELNNHFKSHIGISIATYCWIWTLILSQTSNSKSGSFEISIPQLIHDSQAWTSPKEVFLFFRAFSITIDEMPEFFSKFTTYDTDFASYFYDSPLKQMPFIYTGRAIRTISNNLAASAASFILPHIFKACPEISGKFKDVFTKKFEKHTGSILSNTGLPYHSEDSIKQIYRSFGVSGNKNNVVDHMLTLHDSKKVLLIESKGVEQTDFVKVILDPETLRDRLKDNHIKGIMQSQQCANILANSAQFSDHEFYSFIIVNDDYGFSDAASLERMIGPQLLNSTKYKILDPSPVPLERILFVRISTLEKICSSIQDNEYTLDELLKQINRRELFNNLERLHHTLTESHPAEAIQKFVTIDSPHVRALRTQDSGHSGLYSPSQLITKSRHVLDSIHRTKIAVLAMGLPSSD